MKVISLISASACTVKLKIAMHKCYFCLLKMERKMCMYSIEHCFAHSICVSATEICVWHWNVEGSVTQKIPVVCIQISNLGWKIANFELYMDKFPESMSAISSRKYPSQESNTTRSGGHSPRCCMVLHSSMVSLSSLGRILKSWVQY